MAIISWIQEKGRGYAPIVARLGVVVIFLYFGIYQLIKPANFLGYLPGFLFGKPYATTLIYINGVIELVFGVLLLIGLFTRLSAFILAVHLLGITAHLALDLGFLSDIVWRDIALTIVTFSVVLYGADKWCWDFRKAKS